MPHDLPLFQKVLEDLPFDMEWDLNDPIQASFHKQGMKRYPLQKRLLDVTSESERCSESLGAKKQRTEKGGGAALPAIDGGVKLETAPVEGLDVLIPRLRSQAKTVASLVSTFKNLSLKLELADRTEKTPTTEKSLRKGLTTLEQLESELGRQVPGIRVGSVIPLISRVRRLQEGSPSSRPGSGGLSFYRGFRRALLY